MSTFVWVGTSGTTGDSYGNTGDTGGAAWVSTDNYWNQTTNWRERVAGGQTGNTGGGATGSPGVWYYQAATRIPSGDDKVILEHLENNPSDGISDGPWPKAELLYGGVSSGTWLGASGGTTGDVDIEIQTSYWNTPIASPYSRLRFGTNLSDNPVGGFKGLNLFVDEFNSSSPNTSNLSNDQTKFVLSGDDTTVDTLYVNGIGTYNVKTSSINNLILEGSAYDSNDWNNKSLNYTHIGNIDNLCKVTCVHLDGFNYIPTYNSAVQCDVMKIAPKNVRDTANAVNIRGAVGTMDIYPQEEASAWTGGAKISIDSYQRALTFGTLRLQEHNAWHGIVFNESTDNCRVSFNNANGNDTIQNLYLNAGKFETDDLHSKLTILDGELQVDGTLDLRYKKPTGEVEIAGMSGGTDGEGMFNSSINSTVLLPDGVNFACMVPSGGETAALQGGLGFVSRGGKG